MNKHACTTSPDSSKLVNYATLIQTFSKVSQTALISMLQII
jgi:hypothetical protein